MMKRLEYLFIFVGLYLFIFIVGYLDLITGSEIGFTIFYLVPIMLTSWFFYKCKVSIILIPVLSSIVWLLADVYATHPNSSPWIHYWNMTIRLVMFSVIGIILSRLRISNENEKRLSRTDPLTGLFNSRYFEELISKEINRSVRFSEPFSFAYIDLDNFKVVNDTLGHNQGDQLLRNMTQLMIKNLRDIDITARLGGDEFAIFFPKTDSEQSHVVMTRIYSLIQQNIFAQWDVTLSAGVITFYSAPNNLDEMIHSADMLMYKAKKDGKNKVVYGVANASTQHGVGNETVA